MLIVAMTLGYCRQFLVFEMRWHVSASRKAVIMGRSVATHDSLQSSRQQHAQ